MGRMTSHILADGLRMEHLKLTENTNAVGQIKSYVGKMNERPNKGVNVLHGKAWIVDPWDKIESCNQSCHRFHEDVEDTYAG